MFGAYDLRYVVLNVFHPKIFQHAFDLSIAYIGSIDVGYITTVSSHPMSNGYLDAHRQGKVMQAQERVGSRSSVSSSGVGHPESCHRSVHPLLIFRGYDTCWNCGLLQRWPFQGLCD